MDYSKLDWKKSNVDKSICGYCGMKLDDPKHDKKQCEKEANDAIEEMDKEIREGKWS